MNNKIGTLIYDTLKEEILMNYLHAGALISEKQIADRFDASRTPVRSAIQRLEDNGLVYVKDGVGTFVTIITEKNMTDAYQVRNAIERMAIRTSMYNIDKQDLNRLKEHFLAYRKQIVKGGYGVPFEAITKSDWELHDLIIEKSDNVFLKESVEKATLVLRRYQYSYVSSFERAINEHIEIIDGILNRNEAQLDELLNNHLQFRPV